MVMTAGRFANNNTALGSLNQSIMTSLHAINLKIVGDLERELLQEAAKRRQELEEKRINEMNGIAAAKPTLSPISTICARPNSPYGDTEPTHGQSITTTSIFVTQGSSEEIQKLNPLYPDGAWGFEFNNQGMSQIPYSPWKSLYSNGRHCALSRYMPSCDAEGYVVRPRAIAMLERIVMGEYANTFPFFVGVFLINIPSDKKIDCPRFSNNISKILNAFEEEHRNTGDTISLAAVLGPNSASGTINLLYKADAKIAASGELIFNGNSMEQKRTWIHVKMDTLRKSVLTWDYAKGKRIVSVEEPPPEGACEKPTLIVAGSDLHKIISSNYTKIVREPHAVVKQTAWKMRMDALLTEDMINFLGLEKKAIIDVISFTTSIVKRALKISEEQIALLPSSNPAEYQICLFRLDELDWSAPSDGASMISSNNQGHVSIDLEGKFRIVTAKNTD